MRRIRYADMRIDATTSRPPDPGAGAVEQAALELGGHRVALAVRRSRRARRIALRIDPVAAGVELVLPWRTSLAVGLRFAEARARWVASRLAALPPRVPFIDGAVIPYLGEALTIRHRPECRGPVRREGNDVIVAGASGHLRRRVRDWLKREARAFLAERTRVFAERIGRRVSAIRLGDPRSRWGSCSAAAAIAYSWRLVLAPRSVVDYVVAHEVAHLAELNHGRPFWRLVGTLAGEIDGPRSWLKANGTRLLRYG